MFIHHNRRDSCGAGLSLSPGMVLSSDVVMVTTLGLYFTPLLP